MSAFQTIILGVFGFFIIAGLIVISLVKAGGETQATHISIWGSASGEAMRTLIDEAFDPKTLAVSYTEFKEDELDKALIEALASGNGPDIALLPAPLLTRYLDKIVPIPYATYSERTYKDSFVQEGDLFLSPDSVLALPFTLDPLVMYWNRDFLDEAGVATAPKFWDEFLLLANRLSQRDASGNLSRSAVALGEYKNIASAKEILGALLFQSAGLAESESVVTLASLLARSGASAVLNFYTEFANPQKPVYSWNRSMSDSRQAFLSSRIAVYFGLGSEYPELRRGNPNLNFDIAAFPRPRNAAVGITYGKLAGFAVLRASKNPSAALQVALTLTGSNPLLKLSQETGLPPVRRDLLGEKPTDAYRAVLYDAANRSRGFLESDPVASAGALQDMIESITSGRERAEGAVSRVRGQIR